MKSEAECYSIIDLKKDKRTSWEGVRNFQARNFMRDEMKIGDRILFYHSNAKPSGVVGTATVCSAAHSDMTQFDPADDHYDSKSTKEQPTWVCVDIAFESVFNTPLSLEQIKFDPALEGMMVRQPGSRLSVQPVSEKHFKYILALSGEK